MDKSARIAVSPAGFDDIGAVLREMGSGFSFKDLRWRDITKSDALAKYQVLFINCANKSGNQSYAKEIAPSIRQFVQRGGSLYASDWAAECIAQAFPGQVIFTGEVGPKQALLASVLDEGLQELIGSSLELTFDMSGWRTVQSANPESRVYLKSMKQLSSASLFSNLLPIQQFFPGQRVNLPLLVSFRHGDGQVLFTAFHNEAQTSEIEKKLLRFLVLQPMTAHTSRATRRILDAENSTPGKEIVGSINGGDISHNFTFDRIPDQQLRLVLNWGDSGAVLGMVINDAQGNVIFDQLSSNPPLVWTSPLPLIRDTPNWKCRLVCNQAPYPNFPYVLTEARMASQFPVGSIAPAVLAAKHCPICGHASRPGARFCRQCGNQIR